MARDLRQVAPRSRSGIELHHPEIVAARSGSVDLDDHLGAPIAVNVAGRDRTGSVAQTRAVEVRLKWMARDLRQVAPRSRSGIELHHPEIVASRSGSVDLDDDFGASIIVHIGDRHRARSIVPSPEQ